MKVRKHIQHKNYISESANKIALLFTIHLNRKIISTYAINITIIQNLLNTYKLIIVPILLTKSL